MKCSRVHGTRAEQEGRASCFSTLAVLSASDDSNFSPLRTHPWIPWKHHEYFEVTNKFYQVGKFTNSKYANNEDLPYMRLYIFSPLRFPTEDLSVFLSVSKGHRLKVKQSLHELTDKVGVYKLPSGMESHKALQICFWFLASQKHDHWWHL